MNLVSRIKRLFKREDDTAYHLYGAVVAQARQSAFYLDFGVPDTLDGRFDMIVLHAFLIMRRLEEIGEQGHDLAQRTFDVMFRDMDQSLREMGVGDLSVPKKIKAMAQVFYGRVKVYTAALESSDVTKLKEALTRNILPENIKDGKSGQELESYVRACVDFLSDLTFEDIRSANFAFPAPADYLDQTL